MRLNIEAERGRLQLTKTAMCSALSITSKTYNSYIRGGNIPSSVLEKLKLMTGKSIDYLLNEHSDVDTKEQDANAPCFREKRRM